MQLAPFLDVDGFGKSPLRAVGGDGFVRIKEISAPGRSGAIADGETLARAAYPRKIGVGGGHEPFRLLCLQEALDGARIAEAALGLCVSFEPMERLFAVSGNAPAQWIETANEWTIRMNGAALRA